MRFLLTNEKGGVAILMVLGFMAFGVPIITAALGLASTLSIDSRVKSQILDRHYCGVGEDEFVRYLALDGSRFLAWVALSEEEQKIDFCDAQVPITVSPAPNRPGESPNYSFQEIQSALKEVTPNQATPNILTTFTYTITLKNQGTGTIALERIVDYLPPLLQYSDNTTTGNLTSTNPDTSFDAGDEHCGDEPDQLTWVFSPGINIAPQEVKTLIFQATGTLTDGIYYNKVSMTYRPAWDPTTTIDTHTPYTAQVTVGNGGTKCGFNLELLVRKKVTDVRILAPGETEIAYTISIENVTTNPLPVTKMVDLLPPGFIYQTASSSGIASADPTSAPDPCAQPPDIAGLQRCTLTWETGDEDVPLFTIAAGQVLTQTLKATTKADPGLAFFNEIKLIYDPVDFNNWAIASADTVLLLDNSGSVNDCELVQLRQAANDIVEGFSLDTAEGRIRIGLTRFAGQSSSVADMTDVDSHSQVPIHAALYFPSDGGGSPYALGTTQGCASKQGSFNAGQNVWQEIPDYWDTPPFASDGSIPAATWTYTQWIESGHAQNLWRWKLQHVTDLGVTTVFTTQSANTPPNFDGEVIWYAHPMAVSVQEGDKLRLRLEVWSNRPQLPQRVFRYRWGGAESHSSFLEINIGGASSQPLHDGINGLLKPASGQGGGANLVSGFNFVTGTQYSSGLGDRPDVPNLMIVIVDGSSLPGNSESVANASSSSGAEVFAVGVGPAAVVDPEALFAIAYDPDDPNAVFDPANPDPYYSDHVFHSDDFDELLDLVDDIVEAALWAVQTVVTAEGGSSNGGTLYNMTAVSPDGTVTQYLAIVTSDGEVEILDWPQ